MRKAISLLATCVLAMIGATVHAVPLVVLGPGNVGIQTMGFSFDPGTNTITIREVWSNDGIGVLSISGLDAVNYTVVKVIDNQSGVLWTRLANELLDPETEGGNDALDPKPYPSFVPAGYSTSNDGDGLSFAQGSGIPRTSTVFASVLADELTDVRDFLDFFNGSLPHGGIDSAMSFGLRDTGGNQPFLLVQRPNASSRTVPEPGSLALVSLGLLAAAGLRRRRDKA